MMVRMNSPVPPDRPPRATPAASPASRDGVSSQDQLALDQRDRAALLGPQRDQERRQPILCWTFL